MLALGDQSADAADLYPDRSDIGKATQRERGNGERYRGEARLERTQVLVGDEFIQDHTLSQETSDYSTVLPRYSHHPGDRPENPAQDGLKTGRHHPEPAMQEAEDPVDQRDQRDERN